jgi:hypothetical protein
MNEKIDSGRLVVNGCPAAGDRLSGPSSASKLKKNIQQGKQKKNRLERIALPESEFLRLIEFIG